MWSAELRLQAIGTSYSTANRNRAFTSTSCGCGVSGSQKKNTASMRPSAISEPSCASPPKGPESNSWMGASMADCSVSPVVRVAKMVQRDSVPRLKRAHSTISSLRRSCATRATMGRATSGLGICVTVPSMPHSVTTLARCVTQGADGLCVVRLSENRRTGHQHGSSRVDHAPGRLRSDAAVHLDARSKAALRDPAGELFDLRQAGLDEALAAEPGVHRHHQDQVERIEHILDFVGRRVWLERDSC